MDHRTLLYIAAWILKPILYWAVFAWAQRRWLAADRRRWWRPVAAAVVRSVAGFVIGVPAGIFLANGRPDTIVIPVFSLLRFVLWIGVFALFFRRNVHWRSLDMGTGEGTLWRNQVRNLRMC